MSDIIAQLRKIAEGIPGYDEPWDTLGDDLRCDANFQKEQLTKLLPVIADQLEGMRWVSVKDCYPNDGDTVLAYRPDMPLERRCMASLFVLSLDGKPRWEGLHDVTHWMPLPPPPEESQ